MTVWWKEKDLWLATHQLMEAGLIGSKKQLALWVGKP